MKIFALKSAYIATLLVQSMVAILVGEMRAMREELAVATKEIWTGTLALTKSILSIQTSLHLELR